jgi:hypothetical protein
MGEIAVCGNNVIEGSEVCDLAQVNGETCQSLGYQGGQLGCLLTCTDYNLLGCFICGNEVVDIAEDCEGGVVPEDVTCESLGYQAGDVVCGADCLYDLSECSICGDGVEQGPEDCDGIDFGGDTCATIGFDGGNLACNLASCTFNVGGCMGGQYVQDFEVGVMPPEFTLGGNANWLVDNMMPIGRILVAQRGHRSQPEFHDEPHRQLRGRGHGVVLAPREQRSVLRPPALLRGRHSDHAVVGPRGHCGAVQPQRGRWHAHARVALRQGRQRSGGLRSRVGGRHLAHPGRADLAMPADPPRCYAAGP